MAERKVKVGVEIDGEKRYKQAITELNEGNRVLASEMKKLQAEFQGSTDSMEFYTKKGEILENQLLQQQDKVAKLREAMKHAATTYGESSETTQKWLVSLNEAEAAEFKLQHAIEENNKALQGQDEEMVGLGDTVDQLADKLGIHIPDGAKKALNGMEGLSAGTVASMAAAAAAIAAVVEVVKNLGQMTLDVAAQVDTYLTESAITGVPTEMLQAWDYASGLIDVDADTIKDAMTKITQAMGDASSGNDSAIEKFEQLGVSITNADGSLRSAQEVFYDVVDALGQVENQTERDSLAMDLLGKNAQELTPLFNVGSDAFREYAEEAKNVGYILSEEQVKALGEVDDSFQKLQLTVEGSRRQFAAEFAPAVKAAMELFAEVVDKATKALIDSGLIENLATLLVTIIDIAAELTDLIDGIPSWMNPIQQLSNAFKGLAVVVAAVADAAQAINGLAPWNWGSGMTTTALGWNRGKGQLSHTQQVLYGNADGWVRDPQTGLYVGNYGHNAGGTDYWRGGLTWVGEAGPELVSLPKGSQIMNAQESQQAVGDTFYITMNVDENAIEDLRTLVYWAKHAQSIARMNPHHNERYAPMPNPSAFHG